MTTRMATIVPVWAVALVGCVLVALLDPDGYLIWLPLLLALSLLLAFVVQLAVGNQRGFVDRVMASVGGAVVVLAIATLLLALLNA